MPYVQVRGMPASGGRPATSVRVRLRGCHDDCRPACTAATRGLVRVAETRADHLIYAGRSEPLRSLGHAHGHGTKPRFATRWARDDEAPT
jgi:hypothetical protein